MAPVSVGVLAEIRVATGVGHQGPFVALSVAGSTVYLNDKTMAALLATLCEAELATFVKVSGPAVQP